MSAITQTKNINDFIQAFLATHGVDTEVFDEWKGEETQKAVAALIKSLSPTKEKKIKDPNNVDELEWMFAKMGRPWPTRKSSPKVTQDFIARMERAEH